ncbi:MAG: hypothetical protein A2519_01680 [Candidatus Raymondbacteria bacterium RIFOXYD12_FULL_49_13]|uniref:HTH araC/xylS-type domain-containing protein n=1 Tax=Candidatus Raymondbacteria bacterium RIFOXYD12_FULL_49_13 TaxID=1817890 RepID=A0A1F7F5B5_UNCRA|nr:MAG: hypothetical protein A2519_01680 [Candidatus Raymondbacteria bacterium RIFOXYD12_FULL_49_13]
MLCILKNPRWISQLFVILLFSVPVFPECILKNDFEDTASLKMWGLSKSNVSITPEAAHRGKNGLRLYADTNEAFIQRSVRWPLEEKSVAGGLYIQFSIRLNNRSEQRTPFQSGYCSILEMIMKPPAAGYYCNPALIAAYDDSGRVQLKLLIRSSIEDIPLQILSQHLAFNTWCTVCIFLRIRDGILTDSLFIDGTLAGAKSRALVHTLGFYHNISFGFTHKNNAPFLSCDMDDICIGNKRAGSADTHVEPFSPAQYEYVFPAAPAFTVHGRDNTTSVRVRIDSALRLVRDSVFMPGQTLRFGKDFSPGGMYSYMVKIPGDSLWSEQRTFMISPKRTDSIEENSIGATMAFSSERVTNHYFYGDTVIIEISGIASDSTTYVDLNVQFARHPLLRSDRFGTAKRSMNHIFSLSSGSSVYYSGLEATKEWKLVPPNGQSREYPNDFIVIDQYAFNTRTGKARFAFRLPGYLEQGLWIVNGYIVNDTKGKIYALPTLFFVLQKKRGLLYAAVLCAIIAALGALLIRQRVMRRPLMEKIPEQWKKIAETIEQYLFDHYAEQDLDRYKIAEQAYMSERRLYSIYQAVNGLSPIQHLHNIRLQKAMELLKSTSKSVNEIAYAVGIDGFNNFHRVFKKATGITPGEYRKEHRP